METAAAPPLAAPARMSRKLLFTLTATTALVVGNIYYAQPLLGEIAAAFGTSAASTGRIPTWGQLGYVAGLVLVTPLGDVLEKRRLLVGLLVLAGLALVGAGLAPTFPLLLAASAGIGVTAVLAQILIPFAATLSEPDERARNLGTVLSAALVGVFLSRTVSGAVGGALGWRAMFGIAGGAMFALALLLRLWLPRYEPEERLSTQHRPSTRHSCHSLQSKDAFASTKLHNFRHLHTESVRGTSESEMPYGSSSLLARIQSSVRNKTGPVRANGFSGVGDCGYSAKACSLSCHVNIRKESNLDSKKVRQSGAENHVCVAFARRRYALSPGRTQERDRTTARR
jgi:MFS family permease